MRHFVYERIDLDYITGLKDVKYLSESVWDHFIDAGSFIYEYADDHLNGYSNNLEIGIDILKDQYKLSDKEINKHLDDVKTDILRALSQAYSDNAESGFYDDLKDHCENIADENSCSGYYFVNIKNEKCSIYESAYVIFYMTKNKFIEVFQDERKNYYDTDSDFLADSQCLFSNYLSYKPFDWNHFDYYGTRFDCESPNNWESYLKEYCESPYIIQDERIKKQSRIKDMIKNHVNLDIRQKTINAM